MISGIIPTPPPARPQFEIFARDFAICGGLLLLVGMGPGPFAIDNRGKGAAARSADVAL